MKQCLITELLNVFNFYLSDGIENAVRVFPQHEQWLVAHTGFTFREVQRELQLQSDKLYVPKKAIFAKVKRKAAASKSAIKPATVATFRVK